MGGGLLRPETAISGIPPDILELDLRPLMGPAEINEMGPPEIQVSPLPST